MMPATPMPRAGRRRAVIAQAIRPVRRGKTKGKIAVFALYDPPLLGS
jgi:hypothetical protein